MRISIADPSQIIASKPIVTLAITLALATAGFSQDSEDSVLPLEKPDLKKALLDTAETTQEALKPLVKSPKLQRMLDMVAKSKQHNAESLQKITSGQVKPWQHLIDSKGEVQKQIAGLSLTYQKFLQAEDPAVIKETAHELRRVLNLVGPYLQNADSLSTDKSITEEQSKFLEETSFADKGPAPLPADLTKEADELKLLGPSSYYTLLHLPCPIDLKAKPGSTVYLTTETGGKFPNGLSMQVIKADENGNISTSWKSSGDSIGPGTILITSPQAINRLTLDLNVVKPLLIKIPDLAQLKQSSKALLPVLTK